MNTSIRIVLFGVLCCIIISCVDFLTWRARQIERLEGGSRIIDTGRGVIEYVMSGSGPTILMLHGTLGGYDQLLGFSRLIDQARYQTLLLSRPGYLRTPLSSAISFEEQADLYAATLDALGIERVVVFAVSGAGPSALHFASRYPERCSGLVLIAANSEPPGQGSDALGEPVANRRIHILQNLLLSDINSWLIVRFAQVAPRQTIRLMVGDVYGKEAYIDPERRELFQAMVSSIALLSRRRAGARNDNERYLESGVLPIEDIKTPALILHGTNDFFVTASEQEKLHARLTNSTYIEIESGTHFMLISHPRILIDLMGDFIDTHILEE